MHLDEYQRRAARTIRMDGPDAAVVALFGLAGEVGELLTAFKKHLRDGPVSGPLDSRVDEELGDLLWYLSATATLAGRDLTTIAEQNLIKTSQRWGGPSPVDGLLDDDAPPSERLPRTFTATFVPTDERTCRLSIDGQPAGDPLRDNADPGDDYRWHDVLHLAFAAHLGWSPVLRGILLPDRPKRRSNPVVDEVQDGGRAIVIDEAVVALAFTDAQAHGLYEGADRVPSELLRTIQGLTGHLEVSVCTTGDWQRAILDGFRVWRLLIANDGGHVGVDLHTRQMTFRTP